MEARNDANARNSRKMSHLKNRGPSLAFVLGLLVMWAPESNLTLKPAKSRDADGIFN